MKKWISGLLCLAMVACLFACAEPIPQGPSGYDPSGNTAENVGDLPQVGDENTASNREGTPLMSVEQLLRVTPKSMLESKEFSEEKFFRPFYDGQIQYNEGFFLLENADGAVPDVTCAFPIAKVLEVRSNDLTRLYEEGRDYTVEGGKLCFPAGSRIQAVKQDEFFLSAGAWYEGGRPVINNTGAMYRGHYTVTYIRTEAYDGVTATCAYDALTTFKQKTEEQAAVDLLVVGDSIAAGAGVKGFENWATQVKRGIEYFTESTVNYTNAAVPGIHSAEYVALIDGNTEGVDGKVREDAIKKFAVIEEKKADADLVIIAIGGNDAGGWCGPNGTSVDNYKANVNRMIAFFREANPACSILLVSCMQTNPKITDAGGSKLAAASFSAYENGLKSIVDDGENMALANVFGVESSLLESKNIEDMLGDNINHPSDYMSRVYAQVVLDTLLGLQR